jgi:hypothetical protein
MFIGRRSWQPPNASTGSPRQRHIAYLGSIYESWLSKVLDRAEFWDKMARRLDALGNQIGRDDRSEIEAAIGRKVSRPSEDERRAAEARTAQELRR